MRRSIAGLASVIALLALTASAHGSVLCARLGPDGNPRSAVRIRVACKAREVQLTPDMVGFCCAQTTSTTATTSPGACPTSTTLGAPPCQRVGLECLGVCAGGQPCVDDGAGGCVCSGPPRCEWVAQCGGTCPLGLTCLPFPGCTADGPCECR